MSFSENMAKVVADQLARFVTLNTHQLAGHMANLEFSGLSGPARLGGHRRL